MHNRFSYLSHLKIIDNVILSITYILAIGILQNYFSGFLEQIFDVWAMWPYQNQRLNVHWSKDESEILASWDGFPNWIIEFVQRKGAHEIRPRSRPDLSMVERTETPIPIRTIRTL